MVGIDPDKFFEYSEKHGTSSLPPMEEVAFDEDDPAGAYARMFKKSLEESPGPPFMFILFVFAIILYIDSV